jgi:HTH-type transcriptional regulator, sugar sensing transcriptional regulator
MELSKELQKIGLTEKESKVYLSVLELGEDSVQNIANKSKVNRATTYTILSSLVKKGLCSIYEKAGKTFYIANAPEFLTSLFELQKQEIEERKNSFEKLLPHLQTIHNRKGGKPTIKFFEGRQGLLKCMEEFLDGYEKSNEQVKMAYSKDLLDKLIDPIDRLKFRDIRIKYKVKSKVLYNFKDGKLKDTSDGKRKKVSDKKYPITADFAVYGDRVRIASMGKSVSAVLITDKEVAKTLKTIFELAWKGAGEER